MKNDINSQNILSAEDFSFRHSEKNPEVLRKLSFSIAHGDIVAILGPNGSGKTTLLKSIASLHSSLHSTSGKILLQQQDIRSFSRLNLAHLVTYVPSDVEVLFSISVMDFVAQSRFARREPRETSREKARYYLEETGLLPLSEISFHRLSAGERQLALLARALAQETSILLLDESFSHLDLNFQYHISQILKEYARLKRLTTIFVSHDLNLATEICTHILWLKNGDLKYFGQTEAGFSKAILSEIYPGPPLLLEKNPATGSPKVYFDLRG